MARVLWMMMMMMMMMTPPRTQPNNLARGYGARVDWSDKGGVGCVREAVAVVQVDKVGPRGVKEGERRRCVQARLLSENEGSS